MNRCDIHHEPVCYESTRCPLCKAINENHAIEKESNEAMRELDQARRQMEKLQIEVLLLREEVARLKDPLIAVMTEIQRMEE